MLNRIKDFLNGIKFKTWLYFVIFSLCILALLLLFQIVLFEPYYREMKILDVKNAVNNIAANIDNDEEVRNITINNDGCSVIVKSNMSSSGVDAIGVSCLIYSNGKVNTDYLNSLIESETGELSYRAQLDNTQGPQEMLIYGRTFFDVDGNPYYVIFNTPIQPLNSTIQIMRMQFVLISLFVLALSLLISLFFSNLLSRPITGMTNEANKLSTGNYNVRIPQVEFKEVNDLAQALNFAAEKLSQIDELRKDVIANVSHDIKTPLTMIQAYAEMIRDISGHDEDKRNEHLEVILEESHYLDKLISDMRNLSLLQAGVNTLVMTNFDVAEVISSTVSKFKTITKEEKIKIVMEIEPELICYADEAKIREVVYNFIGNAIKHYGDDRIIIVKAYAMAQSTIRIEVTDHGPGIESEKMSHIWERYYKLDKSYQRANSGTGLGLAICKAILEQHEAQFGVSSELGVGSTFYFELPFSKID